MLIEWQWKIAKENSVPLSFGLMFLNWRSYIWSYWITKICVIIEMTSVRWSDKFTWNGFGFKSDRPLLIANCCTIKLFTMCPVFVRSTHFHKDCHRRGVLFWSEALILRKHYSVQIDVNNGHLLFETHHHCEFFRGYAGFAPCGRPQ